MGAELLQIFSNRISRAAFISEDTFISNPSSREILNRLTMLLLQQWKQHPLINSTSFIMRIPYKSSMIFVQHKHRILF